MYCSTGNNIIIYNTRIYPYIIIEVFLAVFRIFFTSSLTNLEVKGFNIYNSMFVALVVDNLTL